MGLKLKSTNGTGSVELNAPDNHNINTSFTLPTSNFTGGEWVLADGSGNVNIDSGTLYVDAVNNRVGVGTATPAVNLDVDGTIAADGGFYVYNATNDGLGIWYNPGATGVDQLTARVNGSDRLTIDSSGRLLVGPGTAATGTESQYSKLVVAGNTNSSTSAGILNIRKNSGAGSTDYLGRLVYSDDNHDFSYIDSIADGSTTAGRLVFSTCASGGSSPTERMKIDSAGNMKFRNYNDLTTLYNISTGYGITISHFTNASIQIARTNDQMLLLNRLGSNGNVASFYRSGNYVGGIVVTTTSTSFPTSSDYRLKENIVPVTDGIDRLKQLNPSRFNFIAEPTKTVDGFVAHEVQDIVPEAVTGEKDSVEVWKEGDDLPDGVSVGDNKLDDDGNTIPAYQGIDQSKLVPLLTAALQEAIAKIETLEAKVAALEGGTTE